MKKSLLHIQQEIRNLDSKVQSISADIASIFADIAELRDGDKNFIDYEIDYEMIRLRALDIAFTQHPLNKLDDGHACWIYIEILLGVVRSDFDSEHMIRQMIFIQWILIQSRLDTTLENLFIESFKMTSDIFGELVEILPKQYRDSLIVDAMITANICGKVSDEALTYIVNLCSVLGIDKERLKTLSIVTKWVLKKELGRISENNWDKVFALARKFRHYLPADLFWKEV